MLYITKPLLEIKGLLNILIIPLVNELAAFVISSELYA